MSDQFSVLIQGPLSNHSLVNLDIYKKIGPVIISHWTTDNTEILDAYDLDGCTVTSDVLPSRSIPIKIGLTEREDTTFYWAMTSIHNGLKACDTKYIIKIRSDERYSNLQPMVDRIEEFPNAFVTTNIFFKPWRIHEFHISDHIFGGRTDLLLQTWELMLGMWEGNIPAEGWAIQGRDVDKPGRTHMNCPEQIQCKAFLRTIGSPFTKQAVIDNFQMLDVLSLGGYLIQYQQGRAGQGLRWRSPDQATLRYKDGREFTMIGEEWEKRPTPPTGQFLFPETSLDRIEDL